MMMRETMKMGRILMTMMMINCSRYRQTLSVRLLIPMLAVGLCSS